MRQLGLYPVKHESLSMREKLHLIRRAGFDYVCAGSIHQLLEEGSEGLRACAAREGLPIDNVHLTGADTNLVWEEGEKGQAIIDRYQWEMEQAVKAGVPMGVVHVTWGFTKPALTQIGLKRFQALVAHAERVGFTIAFENSVSLAHFEAVLDQNQSPNARFCFDSGHFNEFCADSDIYERYQARMCVTHLDDNDGVRDLHIIPFDGCADFAKIAPALRKMERLTFEVSGALRKTCALTREELLPGMRRLAIFHDAELSHIADKEYAFYQNMSYEAYLDRLMSAARKLRAMIETA